MSDNLQTPRFALPMLSVAQAQKETTHNEALVLIDALLHAPVVDGPLATPPEYPTEGDCGWTVPIAIANPEGGATIDLEARAAIDALLALMVAHGIMIAG